MASSAATDFAAMMLQRVTVDAMMAHLTKLQEIADANDGNRALGTPGYDASVQYVADALRGPGSTSRRRSSRSVCRSPRNR